MKKESKPDYLDMDGDGDKKEPMKNAIKDKKSKGIKKYLQEPNVTNVKPRYVEISGSTEIPAHGPNYNQVIPHMEDGPKKSIVSENYKMPAFAKTGYDTNGSSMHIHYNDGGTGGSMYRDKVEEALGTIKKEATVGQQGVVDEITGLIVSIYSRL